MKSKIFLASSICLIIGVKNVYAKPIDTAFVDDKFYECVIKNYNLENSTNFTVEDNLTEKNAEFSTIEHLTCPNMEITDITGIEKLTSLQTINLSNNAITNIKTMPAEILEELDLSYNNIKEMTLENMPQLGKLKINNNNMEKLIINQYIDSLSLYNNNFLKNINIKVGEEINRLDYLKLSNQEETNKYKVKYEIKDTEIASYDEKTNKIIGKQAGTTTATLTIEGTENENNMIEPLTLESTITVTSDEKTTEEQQEKNPQTGETQEKIENPQTEVKVFTLANIAVALIAIIGYIIIKIKQCKKI